MFTFLEAVYPRESAAKELKRPGTYTQYNKDGEQRFLAASNQIHHKTKKKKRSLVKRYEKLHPYKREEINKRFIDNLKIKGGINMGMLHQVEKPVSIIQNIFPPDQFGYEDIINQWALAYSEETRPQSYHHLPNAPIAEEPDEEDMFGVSKDEEGSIDDEIDCILKHYAGNTVDTATTLKQKEVLDAQKRAKQRLKESKKKEEQAKAEEAKKKRKERVKKKKELEKKRKREIKTMHQNTRKRTDSNSRAKSKGRDTRNREAATAINSMVNQDGLGETQPDNQKQEEVNMQLQINLEEGSDSILNQNTEAKLSNVESNTQSKRYASYSEEDDEEYDQDFDNDQEEGKIQLTIV